MNPFDRMNRRAFLSGGINLLGTLGLSSLLSPKLLGSDSGRWHGVMNPPPVSPKIRRVIHLYMAGGPSHLESFDYKPKLAELNGQPMPESYTSGQQIAQLQGTKLKILGPTHPFQRHGDCGMEICSIFPHLSKLADDICVIRSMQTDQINHDTAHTFMNTGTAISGRPSMGSWVLYGLGCETQDLPGFVVLSSAGGGQTQPIAARQWHSGFLPSRFQGVELQSKGDPVLYVGNPAGVSKERQRDVINAVQALNRLGDMRRPDPEIETRIAQYEMAFRMQSSVPGLMDLSDEPDSIKKLYGTEGADGTFASNCLLARRLAERGVRFIQVYHRGWDHHGGIKDGIAYTASLVDQASAALIHDLKQRGMLDDTLVIWGGEFGRTPMAQGNGRDHHIKGFSLFLTGGGIHGGKVYGATDELGYNAIEDVVHVHDLHATLLHLLGLDHEKLTYRFQGRDFRLTDTSGRILHDVLA